MQLAARLGQCTRRGLDYLLMVGAALVGLRGPSLGLPILTATFPLYTSPLPFHIL